MTHTHSNASFQIPSEMVISSHKISDTVVSEVTVLLRYIYAKLNMVKPLSYLGSLVPKGGYISYIFWLGISRARELH